MNESEVNLIENSLYANPNMVARDRPPPIPDRPLNLDDDYNPNDSGVDTLRSNLNGYSSIADRPKNRLYEEIPQTPTTHKNRDDLEELDPYQLEFDKKVQMFNEKSREPESEVWIKRRDQRNSVPDLYSKIKKAPLAPQEVRNDWNNNKQLLHCKTVRQVIIRGGKTL